MKGLFIPEITTEMFRNGCLESIESLMAEGKIYDIDYPLEQEPCEDCVSRQAVLDLMQIKIGGKELYTAIYELPPVTPQPKTGHWIVEESEFNIYVKCSCCNYIVNYFWSDCNKAPYCPNCGAKMVEPQAESEET